ncbi:nicotinate phosphoribosyltransferase [Hydrogenivirga sp. 128-5-R1-1]|uniref:nicotinate phosphoribosyltransferase n=1 Tax=Hydrogenivirga sp. 128-5-R1-1 TaxID=392423 RepID=UPI00015F17A3|nr:nicotinate phosphoribosyltransferase [Hydrogenivirga sp. 128-5-R1-1]EDP76033.1 nicotinate phosphoribosyltransferase [Hydrogenivirga sp. 128-5-R1-1]
MQNLGLCTDLYELTMAQSYLEHNKIGNAVFSLFVRKLPPQRNFLVACGLETLLELIEDFRFGDEELKYLKSLGRFSDSFLEYLSEYEFRGNLYAIPEGRVVFQNEPIVQVEGSLPEVQILETLVINAVHLQTVIASKAVRSFVVSRGRSLVDFGFRRAHGLEAGIYAARASYIAGFAGTSNLEAGRRFSIPVFGTVAHSYIMVFDKEEEAFKAFAESFPQNAVFLLDTYDTIDAARKTVELAKKGVPVVGVRLDSGDIESLSREVRRILDKGGLKDVRIIVSGGVDEYRIEEWLSKGCPIDAFGVGTKFITSADAPYLDMAYKLVEYEGKPKVKTSPGKATFPFKRQVCRFYRDGVMEHDEVVVYGEESEGERLVKKVLEGGRLVDKLPSLEEVRETLLADLDRLPDRLKSLDKSEYEVIIK